MIKCSVFDDFTLLEMVHNSVQLAKSLSEFLGFASVLAFLQFRTSKSEERASLKDFFILNSMNPRSPIEIASNQLESLSVSELETISNHLERFRKGSIISNPINKSDLQTMLANVKAHKTVPQSVTAGLQAVTAVC